MPAKLNTIAKNPKLLLGNIDEARIENLIAKEKSNLIDMFWQFMDNFVLCRLQLKLINALKSLLKLLNKPNLSLQELMQQLLKISAIYSEVNSELDKAKQRHQDLAFELKAQQKKADELLITASETYYDERISNYRRQAQFERAEKQAKLKQADEAKAIKFMLQRNASLAAQKEQRLAIIAARQAERQAHQTPEKMKIREELKKLGATLGISLVWGRPNHLSLRAHTRKKAITQPQDFQNFKRLVDEYNAHVNDSVIEDHIRNFRFSP